jgi:hypothetical protein
VPLALKELIKNNEQFFTLNQAHQAKGVMVEMMIEMFCNDPFAFPHWAKLFPDIFHKFQCLIPLLKRL